MRTRAICVAVLVACSAPPAYAAEVRSVTVRDGATGTRAEIALSSPADSTLIRLQGPDRLGVDLTASTLSKAIALPSGGGAVSRVRSGQPVAGTARLVFDLAQPIAALAPRVEQGASGSVLVIEWPGDGKSTSLASKSPSVIPAPANSVAAKIIPDAIVAGPPAAPVVHDDAAQVVASAEATSKLIAAMGGAVPHSPVVASKPNPMPASTVATASPSVARQTIDSVVARAPAVGVAAVTRTPVSASETRAAAPTMPMASTLASPAGGQDAATISTLPGRIATGVPTRIATGVPAAPTASATTSPVPGRETASARGTRALVIAIDPGHGGQDPGAVGLNGNREKDVTLAISRELARQINATPGLKAFLTRDADMFLPLGNRARLARSAKADMFISIHADAAENRNARGSSVYVLSLKGASSQRARWLADKENRADLIGGARYKQADTMLTSVLLDLTQSGHMRASEDAGTEILSGLKRIGNHHKPHIERANFAVLRTSDMPSMLVETAFISNPDEEARLIDPAFQKQLARAVLDGVDTYFKRQPPPGTLYAARAGEMAVASVTGGAP